jgi:hypothetical protein
MAPMPVFQLPCSPHAIMIPYHLCAGTPWTPAPVAEDYEETIQILLNSHKVKHTNKKDLSCVHKCDLIHLCCQFITGGGRT